MATYQQGPDPFQPTTGDFEIYKEVEDDLFIVRRRSDSELFIASSCGVSQDALASALEENGSLYAASQVLNHEHLVSIVGTEVSLPISAWSSGERARLLIWDHMDAGRLEAVFDHDDVWKTVPGFQPESLVWHVALSVLSALAWLHEGKRDVWAADTVAQQGAAGHEQAPRELDWLPILHGRVAAQNIFFQQPRGIETYGACKLGDFTGSLVCGRTTHVARGEIYYLAQGVRRLMPDDLTRGGVGRGVVMAEVSPGGIVGAVNLWKLNEAGDPTAREIPNPFTCGDDLYGLGRVLFRMMVHRPCPLARPCRKCGCTHLNNQQPCQHNCTEFPDTFPEAELRDIAAYTPGIKTLVVTLLRQASTGQDVTASQLLTRYRNNEYKQWKEGTPEGRLYKDFLDDMRWRGENEQARQGPAGAA